MIILSSSKCNVFVINIFTIIIILDANFSDANLGDANIGQFIEYFNPNDDGFDYDQFPNDFYGWKIDTYDDMFDHASHDRRFDPSTSAQHLNGWSPMEQKLFGKNGARAWALEESDGIFTSLAAPSYHECKEYKRAGAKCFPNVGCFGTGQSDLDYLFRLPEEGVKVAFKIYTKENPRGGVLIDPGSKKSLNNVKDGAKTIFYFHGFFQKATSGEAGKVRDAFLSYNHYDQVIIPDYEWAVRGISYHRAVANTDYIGR